MNEEEVKIKYVLPWIHALGIPLEDLTFEMSFKLRIGRQTVIVGHPGRKLVNSVGGRLDILIRHGTKNLLVVETKAEDIALTDEDRDQAVSYARLVHPIAPYALVTNGRDVRLYDTVTKSQVSSESVRTSGFNVDLPQDLITEAQRIFFNLDPRNLIEFLKLQARRELNLLSGTRGDLSKKFVPELHVVREAVATALEDHITSANPALMLTGNSGIGKSCDLCWAANELLSRGLPIMFFNGVSIEGTLAQAIAAEFSWTFGEKETETTILRRLSRLLPNTPLTIIVDAIDEWTYPLRSQHLSRFATAAQEEGIKVILSCKSSVVAEFLRLRDIPTHTASLCTIVEIPQFSYRDFFRALTKYRDVYEFQGGFEGEVLKRAQENPFLLRVLFESLGSSGQVDLTFDSTVLFNLFLKKTVARLTEPETAKSILILIAELLYEENANWIGKNELCKRISLSPADPTLAELVRFGVLNQGVVEEETTISFYFQQLRDYLIAFHACRFQNFSDELFSTEVAKRKPFSNVSLDVMTLYYRLAKSEHKRLLDEPMYGNARKLVTRYQKYIADHFPALRTRFFPKSDGPIGIIGELDLFRDKLGLYGFRVIAPHDELVHFVPVLSHEVESNLSWLQGATDMLWTRQDNGLIAGTDIDEEVKNSLLYQFRGMIEQGYFDESSCPELMHEHIIRTIENNAKIFRPLLDHRGRRIKSQLCLNDLYSCLYTERLQVHFEHIMVNELRESGQIKETWADSTVSFSSDMSIVQRMQVNEQVEAARKAALIPTPFHNRTDIAALEALVKRFEDAFTLLAEFGETRLSRAESTLIAHREAGSPIPKDVLEEYVVAFAHAYLDSYRNLIETNFPTTKQHVPFYREGPYDAIVEFKTDGTLEHVLNVTIYLSARLRDAPTVTLSPHTLKFYRDKNDHRMCFDCGGEKLYFDKLIHLNMDALLKPGYITFTPMGLSGNAFKNMRLRTLVYSDLVRDFLHLKDAVETLTA